MRVVVSGVGGFVGAHLTRELVGAGHEVTGLSNGPVDREVRALLAGFVEVDLTLEWPRVECEAVVHLAGLSAVGPSFANPQAYLQANSAPMTHLCEDLLARGRAPRVVVVSTGAVYLPGVDLDESAPTEPSSPYAVSKLLVELQSAYYRRRGLDLVVMRPFNHLGPGQRAGFLLPDLMSGVRKGRLIVGDLNTRRDYTDVRDVARAYRLAIEVDRIEVPTLNVCSGRSTSGHEMLDLALAASDLPSPDIVVDPSRRRPDDPREIRGDHALIRRVLGWEPAIPLRRTVEDFVDDLES